LEKKHWVTTGQEMGGKDITKERLKATPLSDIFCINFVRKIIFLLEKKLGNSQGI